eukprot:3385578-Ditylum_brightwellii.AAC.1
MIFKWKTLGMAVGIQGFVEGMIDSFYLPHGREDATQLSEDAKANYITLLGKDLITTTKIKKNKGNNLAPWLNNLVKWFDDIQKEELSEEVKTTIKNLPSGSEDGKKCFTYVAKAVQFICSPELVNAVLGSKGTMAWVDVIPERHRLPKTRNANADFAMFGVETPPMWDLVAFQLSLTQHAEWKGNENSLDLVAASRYS